ncbi:dTDP-4-dehydrorhamnose reductase [Flavobacterium paronense]|uniref:dTDP-4-dehydrorhamnose reductase n=1 Tax=Flavobacterium paronense TaxID=1392775 RepID=A0ABV5GES4_9FLAO|nr:dTDP-4-dehydrorhamnose reductase [Flavobacterium paronense]MDN3678436.1 dTDP-4-dehydrorhamnose reductase [Flavobacterium paronense]
MVVLVSGANGQLGQSLQFIAPNYPDIHFIFCSSADLDISNLENCQTVFSKIKPNYCINAAAYTAVDKAESEPEKAYLINVIGAQNLAAVCKQYATVLLHVSTDFVFDGNASKPYSEDDIPNPTGVYGQTKLDGEKGIQATFENYYIIRTSWVYSQFANNFMKTMLRLASERDSISVVNDQIGTPTNAVDLAAALVQIALTDNRQPTTDNFGIYNFSNEGQCSWYDFAKKIFEINNKNIDLKPIPTSSFPTPAKRPKFSVLDKTKIKNTFGLEIKSWEDSLKTI